jgi:glycosyltransferase involved in cell wall biosynthesis
MRYLIEKNGLTPKTKVISGLLTPEEIAKYILSADVVCLPFKCVVSDVPIVTFEILAAGIPLITTKVTGVSEFLKDGRGIIVPPQNDKALANALIHVLRGRDKIKMKTNAESLIERLNFEKFAFSYEKILKEVIVR